MYQPEDIFVTEVPPSNVIGCWQFSHLHKFAQFQNAACVQVSDESCVAACGQLENVPSRQHIPWYEERRRRSGCLWVADDSGTRCGVALHPRGELASIVARYATIAEPGHSSRRSEWGSSTQFRG